MAPRRQMYTFAAIRRQREFVLGWFQQWLGYRLVVERDFARLHKVALPEPDSQSSRTATH